MLRALLLAQLLSPRPVTDERLKSPEPENWLMYRGNYASWGYSPLDQIRRENVSRLAPLWTFSTGVGEGHQSPPIVNDGLMYLTTPWDQVLALDARTGDLLWRYERDLPDDLKGLHPANRGVALYLDKVYLATLDAFVVALDASTGEMVWKTFTVPAPGEPGHETWTEDAWRTGGAPVWITGSYDPALGLTYWGTGNAAPWIGDARPGDNLYSSSVIALEASTGVLAAHHQYHWNDSWDWDEVAAPLLVDVERSGRSIPALVHPGRNGYLWLLERSGSKIGFVDAWPFVHQDVFTKIDRATGRPEYDLSKKPSTGKIASFCPSLWGGKNWTPAAYNPETRLLYVPANDNLCMTWEGEKAKYVPGERFTGPAVRRTRGMFVREGATHVGELQAWDLASGKKVWTETFDGPNWGPVLTTAGGLVFMGGTNDRYFRAFDAETGEGLWRERTNSGITCVPTSYSLDGIQYVAVQSGWGVDAQKMQASLDGVRGTSTFVPQGGVLWVFALEREDRDGLEHRTLPEIG